MANTKKLIQAAAGAGGAETLNVEDVFGVYRYDGTGSSQSITNNVNLSDEGGMVWTKNYTADPHILVDSERGLINRISFDAGAQSEDTGEITSFDTDGFSLGTGGSTNGNGNEYMSWAFRKCPKFFDIQTYTGTGSARTISHNLDATVGSIWVKRLDAASGADWCVYHRSAGATGIMQLNKTNAFYIDSGFWNDTNPTTSVFHLGDRSQVNASGGSYVAYIFAHNNNDGEFGVDSDQDIIKCGSFSTDTNGDATINLGFEPQFLIVKLKDTTSGGWMVIDDTRGWGLKDSYVKYFPTQSTAGQSDMGAAYFTVNATGFTCNQYFTNKDYLYWAIRRPMAVPEAGTDVFQPKNSNNGAVPTFRTGFATDLSIYYQSSGSEKFVATRLLNRRRLRTSTTGVEDAQTEHQFDFMNGAIDYANLNGYHGWHWKRAPQFCEIVGYTGTGSNLSLQHNLGVAPEMAWIKRRNAVGGWVVGFPALSNTAYGFLNDTDTFITSGGNQYFQDTTWSDQYLYLRTDQDVNASGSDYVAYLFASLAGVSKVGSYTGTGGYVLNDCGFSAGARFILIKRTDAAGDWYLWDTNRGITSGNDPYSLLNSNSGEVTNTDYIAADSRGFYVSFNAPAALNASGGSYIFYAIA